MSKVCSKCGSVMNDTARFCNKCGTPFSKQTVEIQQQQPQNNQQQSYQQQNYQQPQSFRMGWGGLLVD